MSHDLRDLKQRPVPPSIEVMARKVGYRTAIPIDAGHIFTQEACVDIRATGIAGANHYNTAINPPYYVKVPGAIPELYLRRSVAAKLIDVNARLSAIGLGLYVFDAWRPQAVQRFFHDQWFPDWLQQRHPDLKGAALQEEVEEYWSAPSDGDASPSPHATGGAVDLTLMTAETRQPLFMGGIFDDLTSEAWTDGYETRLAQSMSDEEARANRRLLYWVMTQAGFANNPTEWWHYSWGDQMWARLMDQPAAHYGSCHPACRTDL